MVTRDGRQLARESKETGQIAKPEAKHKISPFSPPPLVTSLVRAGKAPVRPADGLLTRVRDVSGSPKGRNSLQFLLVDA